MEALPSWFSGRAEALPGGACPAPDADEGAREEYNRLVAPLMPIAIEFQPHTRRAARQKPGRIPALISPRTSVSSAQTAMNSPMLTITLKHTAVNKVAPHAFTASSIEESNKKAVAPASTQPAQSIAITTFPYFLLCFPQRANHGLSTLRSAFGRYNSASLPDRDWQPGASGRRLSNSGAHGADRQRLF